MLPVLHYKNPLNTKKNKRPEIRLPDYNRRLFNLTVLVNAVAVQRYIVNTLS
jgi:hypothetical protein